MKANLTTQSGRISFGLVAIIVLIGLVLAGVLMVVSAKNGAVDKDEAVKRSWGDVEAQYQRRSDLVPNLVRTVQGAADFEQETLQAVTEARASVGKVELSGDALLNNPEALQQFMAAQNQLGGALSRLLVAVEKYPQLTATEGYMSLQHQLEGTENRIRIARSDFNKAVEAFNAHVRRIPNKWFLSAEEFPLRQPFQAISEGAEQAPVVDFGGND